jgi:NADPH:quinone reductase
MRAIQFSEYGGPEVLKEVSVPKPVPQADELLIDVAAAGVGLGDARERAGVYQSAETKLDGVTLPRIPGIQVVGTVSEVGDSADPGLLGRTVMAFLPKGGGYAEYAVTLPKFAVPLPATANATEMAALPAQGVSAWLMLTAASELHPGESVLVHGGAGGVGSLAIQIAKALGAGLVVATAATPEKRAFATSLGADVAMDYEDRNWPQDVLARTDGRGVDIILESLGGDLFAQNFECLAARGRVILFSSIRPAQPFPPRRLLAKSQTLSGFFAGSFIESPEIVREALEFLVDHAIDGSVRPQVAMTLPLSQAAESHRLLEARKVKGVIVLANP